MSKRGAKFWVGIGAIALLTPVLAMAQHHGGPGPGPGGPPPGPSGNCNPNWGQKCQSVPEGGSSAGYLVAVGTAIVGAVLLRSRMNRALS